MQTWDRNAVIVRRRSSREHSRAAGIFAVRLFVSRGSRLFDRPGGVFRHHRWVAHYLWHITHPWQLRCVH